MPGLCKFTTVYDAPRGTGPTPNRGPRTFINGIKRTLRKGIFTRNRRSAPAPAAVHATLIVAARTARRRRAACASNSGGLGAPGVQRPCTDYTLFAAKMDSARSVGHTEPFRNAPQQGFGYSIIESTQFYCRSSVSKCRMHLVCPNETRS